MSLIWVAFIFISNSTRVHLEEDWEWDPFLNAASIQSILTQGCFNQSNTVWTHPKNNNRLKLYFIFIYSFSFFFLRFLMLQCSPSWNRKMAALMQAWYLNLLTALQTLRTCPVMTCWKMGPIVTEHRLANGC